MKKYNSFTIIFKGHNIKSINALTKNNTVRRFANLNQINILASID